LSLEQHPLEPVGPLVGALRLLGCIGKLRQRAFGQRQRGIRPAVYLDAARISRPTPLGRSSVSSGTKARVRPSLPG